MAQNVFMSLNIHSFINFCTLELLYCTQAGLPFSLWHANYVLLCPTNFVLFPTTDAFIFIMGEGQYFI